MTFGTGRNPRSTLEHVDLFSLDFIVSQQGIILTNSIGSNQKPLTPNYQQILV